NFCRSRRLQYKLSVVLLKGLRFQKGRPAEHRFSDRARRQNCTRNLFLFQYQLRIEIQFRTDDEIYYRTKCVKSRTVRQKCTVLRERHRADLYAKLRLLSPYAASDNGRNAQLAVFAAESA